MGCLGVRQCRLSRTGYVQGEKKNSNHRAKKDETHRDFNIIYSTRSVILDNLNLSIES